MRGLYLLSMLSICSTSFAQELKPTDLSKLNFDRKAFSISTLMPKQFPRQCPRVDIIRIRKDFSAINVNGYTIGHASGLQFPTSGGPMFVGREGLSIETKTLPDSPIVDCRKIDVDLSLNGQTGKLAIQGIPLGTFDRFVWTEDNLRAILGAGSVNNDLSDITISESDSGLSGRVTSGPSRPQPKDDGGNGGPDTGQPTENPFPGPKTTPDCCRGGA
ncbi:hypothetical protein [Pararhizobium gei]|uniref:hypothetical protein n=1 Tax=Pararhizobium gei TaxID=1395951 RepID=UPI0023DB8E4D|nr:hypothetical protein [Rhizobium gei]